MTDLQNRMLQVIKARCEEEDATGGIAGNSGP